jgi:MFS family permease
MNMDVGFSKEEYAGLASFGFTTTFAGASLFAGNFADKLDRRGILAVSSLVWSTATALQGFASDYWQLLPLRAVVGTAQAFFNPAAYTLLADEFPPERVAQVNGVLTSGIYLGGALSSLAILLNEQVITLFFFFFFFFFFFLFLFLFFFFFFFFFPPSSSSSPPLPSTTQLMHYFFFFTCPLVCIPMPTYTYTNAQLRLDGGPRWSPWASWEHFSRALPLSLCTSLAMSVSTHSWLHACRLRTQTPRAASRRRRSGQMWCS